MQIGFRPSLAIREKRSSKDLQTQIVSVVSQGGHHGKLRFHCRGSLPGDFENKRANPALSPWAPLLRLVSNPQLGQRTEAGPCLVVSTERWST